MIVCMRVCDYVCVYVCMCVVDGKRSGETTYVPGVSLFLYCMFLSGLTRYPVHTQHTNTVVYTHTVYCEHTQTYMHTYTHNIHT